MEHDKLTQTLCFASIIATSYCIVLRALFFLIYSWRKGDKGRCYLSMLLCCDYPMSTSGQLPCLDSLEDGAESYYQPDGSQRACTVRVAQSFAVLQLVFEDVLQIIVAFRLEGVVGFDKLNEMGDLGNSVLLSLIGSSLMILVGALKLMYRCCCITPSGAKVLAS